MWITEIKPITNKKVRVVTDEELAFVLYKGELSRYHLKEDQELSQETYQQIQNEVLKKRAKLRAMHLLNRQDYTEAGLYRKLEQGEYTKEAIEEAIDYVRSYHYLDDARYAENYIRFRLGKKSRRQLSFELEQKGVSRTIIQEILERTAGDNEAEQILIQLRRRCPDISSLDGKERNKHMAYFLRKGYQSHDIRMAMDQLEEEQTARS